MSSKTDNCAFNVSSIILAIAPCFSFPSVRLASPACPRDIFCFHKGGGGIKPNRGLKIRSLSASLRRKIFRRMRHKPHGRFCGCKQNPPTLQTISEATRQRGGNDRNRKLIVSYLWRMVSPDFLSTRAMEIRRDGRQTAGDASRKVWGIAVKGKGGRQTYRYLIRWSYLL